MKLAMRQCAFHAGVFKSNFFMAVKIDPERTHFPVIIVTGLAGAGKSTVLQAFEDLRYFTVDGLPVELGAELVKVLNQETLFQYRGLVLGMDLRQVHFLDFFHKTLGTLAAIGVKPILLFVEAGPEVLLRRYATTRRPHPLEREGFSLGHSLAEDRHRLEGLRAMADFIVDTSAYNIHDLRRFIQRKWGKINAEKIRTFKVNLVSFGFKYGLPADADIMLDFRFLPNPYFVPELKELTGRDTEVAQYVLTSAVGRQAYDKVERFLLDMLPFYEAEGRYRICIAIGCTGGRHRSVAVSEALYTALKKADYAVTLEHRHMELS